MSVTKSTGLETEDFFADLVTNLQTTFAQDSEAVDIVDFVEREIDPEKWGIKLSDRQLLVLKCFYNCELTDDELGILESLAALERTNFDVERYKEEGPSDEVKQALVVECGRRGGKTLLGAVIIAYEFYKLCLKPCPQKNYGMGANTPIVIYCLATGAEQTKKTIYGQARALLYFIPKIARLIDNGEIIVGETEVKYPSKLLYIYSGNSKSSSQVGSSVILLVMDEVARFKNDNGESNALELWSNIGVSGVTFGSDARRVAISSAWEEGDAIQKLNEMSMKLEVRSSFASFRLRSWDLNPDGAARDNPVIAAEYASNPKQAATEFEGIRFNGLNCFLEESEVERAFTKGLTTIKVEKLPITDDKLVRLRVNSVLKSNHTTYMHLDPAVKRDAYAMAYGHGERAPGEEVKVIIDGLLAWEPFDGNQVSITNVQSVIYDIHSIRPIAKLTADHQHSPETIERLKANGINASTIYFSRAIQLEMYDCLRQLLHEDRIVLPRNSPWSVLLKDELLNVQLINGVKIDHRPEKSKDLADCVASIAWQIVGPNATGNWESAKPLIMPTTKRLVPVAGSSEEDEFATNSRDFRRTLRAKSSWGSSFSSCDD
jgi:hypothetical protein